MRRVARIAPAGYWPVEHAAMSVTLVYEDRYRRRMVITADDGSSTFLLDLPQARVLNDGDGLVLDDGAIALVRAATERVCDVICESPEALARIAWHLGNRHLPVQVIPGGLRIRDDHVIVDMLVRLGARVTPRQAPFTPEGGAYASAHGHAHGDHHSNHHHRPSDHQAHGH